MGGSSLTLDALQILHILKRLDLCTNLAGGADLTFDQLLSAFYKEISRNGKASLESLTLPAIVGEGCHVDLLKLFSLVHERGGHWHVSTSSSWDDVAESIGLGSNLGPSVKLVYVKYLSSLEKWVKRASERKTDPVLLGNVSRPTENPNEGLPSLLKRKRDLTIRMLNWVRDLAKRPCDPSNDVASMIDEANNGGKQNLAVDYFNFAVLMRRRIFRKNTRKSKHSATNQNVPETSSPNSKGIKTRKSPRINQTSSPETPITNQKNKTPNSPPFSYLSIDEQSEIPVGPKHQAVVPIRTNYIPNSDPDSLKYLGTQLWPPDNPSLCPKGKRERKKKSKGCECIVPGSVDCVRFHIAENRLELKRELGPAFHRMGFHKMGEEVSLSWKEEEEKKFKLVIRENSPDEGFNFWNPLKSKFPYKEWRALTSYYFDVFLVRRRAYQNRLVPTEIRSDDEAMESGFLDATDFCVQNSQCIDLDP